VSSAGASHIVVRRLFLKALALVYLSAFASLLVQVRGLIGVQGILPAAELLEWASLRAGAERYWILPTLAWISASDGFLMSLCLGGGLLSIALLLDLAPALLLALLWAFYLSLVTVGQVFLGYQWDALLLETGLLAIFLAPLRVGRDRSADPPPSPVVLWLMRFLLFRLTFGSGAVKLLSGDRAWRSLTALRFHYETQPLPAWTSWYAHQLPPAVQTVSTAFMFGIELLVPFLIFGPRRLRLAAALIMASLQALIALTGNYAFFNYLTIALCLLLLDDAALPRRLGGGDSIAETARPGGRWPMAVVAPISGVLGLLAVAVLAGTCGLRIPWPSPVVALYRFLAPFHAVNSYGLFAVMTTTRPEIVLEGSADGVVWKPYAFKWKPGDVQRAPRFVAPHQPRLDWQMWFAALGSCEQNVWLVRTMERLVGGAKPVAALLADDPFAGTPPRSVRAVLYDYRFTDWAERRRTGAWWRREAKGAYCPPVSRDDTVWPLAPRQ
jgi:lipase maturation factor 1